MRDFRACRNFRGTFALFPLPDDFITVHAPQLLIGICGAERWQFVAQTLVGYAVGLCPARFVDV